MLCSNLRRTALGAFLSSACTLGTPAFAQDGSGDASASAGRSGTASGLEDIVVTARKRAESLVDVPVAVTAMSSADIARYAATDLNKVASLAPQVVIARTNTGAGASFVIRGIGSPSQDTGIEQTVSINIDGVQISRGRVVTQGLFDLQQVEVLKGPQALFFGKNSPAGVISITSASPADTLEGYARAGYEIVARERFAEAAIGGPLAGTLKARIAVRAGKMDGYFSNRAKPTPYPLNPSVILPGAWDRRQPGSKEILGRVTIVWEPTSRLNTTLKVLAGNFKSNDSGSFQPICTPGVTMPTVLGAPDTQDDCKPDKYRAATAMPTVYAKNWSLARGGIPYVDQDSVLASLNTNYDLGSIGITSVTGYYYGKRQSFDNATGSSLGGAFAGVQENSKQYSQELRVSSDFDGIFNFTVGAYYDHTDRYTVVQSQVPGVQSPADAQDGFFYGFRRLSFAKGNTYSAFGQARIAVRENLEVAGGVRYTKEDKRLRIGNDQVNSSPFTVGFLVPEGQYLSGRFKDDNWSPEVTLTWHPVDDMTVYGAYKTGYKSGGFSEASALTRALSSAAALRFESESAKGGEIGFKARLFDSRVRLDLTAYNYVYSDLQQVSYDQPTNTFQVRNAAKARTRGLEGSLDWRATDELTLRSSIGYNRATYKNFKTAPCYPGQTVAQGCVARVQDLTGKELTRAPRVAFTVGGSYDVPIGNGLMLGISADTNYSDRYFTQENERPFAQMPSYWLLNGSVKLYQENKGFELALIGRNLTNKYVYAISIDRPTSPTDVITTPNRPREVLLQGTYRF